MSRQEPLRFRCRNHSSGLWTIEFPVIRIAFAVAFIKPEKQISSCSSTHTVLRVAEHDEPTEYL